MLSKKSKPVGEEKLRFREELSNNPAYAGQIVGDYALCAEKYATPPDNYQPCGIRANKWFLPTWSDSLVAWTDFYRAFGLPQTSETRKRG